MNREASINKTKFDRIDVGVPGVAVFRIAGKLGFHENDMVHRLAEECLKRRLRTVVFDFSELSSLGGGVAKILREFVGAAGREGGSVRFVVTKEIVAQFLRNEDASLAVYRTLEEALAAEGSSAPQSEPAPPAGSAASTAAPAQGRRAASPNVILMAYDTVEGTAPAEPHSPAGQSAEGESGTAAPVSSGSQHGNDTEVFSEIFGAAPTQAPSGRVDARSSASESEPPKREEEATVGGLNRQLKRRILELKTLFSISTDFNAVRDRKKLIDIFLLTSIAQGGVESAVFLESTGGVFKPYMSKGLESEAVAGLEIPANALSKVSGENNVIPIDSFPIEDGSREVIRKRGIEYVCPFLQKEGIGGLVLLGKRITGRGMKEEDFEFLRILVNIAQGAYDNALMFEHEHERTLGIVKSLISIIEENTLLKGTSEFVSRYVGMVAKSMDYPEEHFKDLIYGAVLRDMGMVKVSDLILRSPRDLTKEEWEIIKRHPEDGAEMLTRMKFGEHVVGIVRTHHERFNGEGYPYGLRGKEIPLGARIISVVESYAAMIHERPNRPALSEREALDTLKENFGLRYDREVVTYFVKIMEKELAQSAGVGVGAERGR
jgi:HD-GYP domain-containing protein (c-di-GMP phosphodiesterase class II)/anti-anti-sigma regulatory factor